jgi:arylsulfatase A-like enzyme
VTPLNVLLIVADDLGWKDVGYHGSEINTPTINRLAKQGVELNRFYIHPTCSPTRSALMTGKAPLRLGILSPLAKNNKIGLPLSEKTMAEFFQENGYQTSLVGKWHLGRFKKEYWPTNIGFDHFYGYLTGGIGHYDHVHGGGLDWQRKNTSIGEEGYTTHLLTNETIQLINEPPSDKPYFIELCFASPHLPNDAPEKTAAQYEQLPNKNRQLHAAMVTEVDMGIQRIYETLEAEDLLDKTIIWFTSYNGGLNETAVPDAIKKPVEKLTKIFGRPLPIATLEFTRTNLEKSAADNMPFLECKGSPYEGGVRVPSFIYAPNILSPQKVESCITINDVLSTIASAVGFKDYDSSVLDGVSQWDFLNGAMEAPSNDYITHGEYGAEAYFKDNFKLIVSTDGEPELYNLIDDPTKSKDLANENMAIVNDIMKRLKAFPLGESVHDPIWKSILNMDKFGGEED